VAHVTQLHVCATAPTCSKRYKGPPGIPDYADMPRFQIGGQLLSALCGSSIVLFDGGAPFTTCRASAWTVFYTVPA
jgi:hypothetical protein